MAYSAGKRGAAAYNRYARKKKDEEEKPVQPAEPQESEPAPVAAPQEPKQQTAPQTEPQQERKPFTMPETAKRDQERGFTRTVQEYADQTSVKLVEAGEMTLPPEMEEHREVLEENNREGLMGNGTSFGYAENVISVDPKSIKDDKHLFFFGTTLTDDAERRKLYEAYAAEHGIDLQDLMYRAEKTLGTKAFDFPQSAKGQLEYAGVYDVAGNPLDMNTARASQVDAAIRMIPPGDEHDLAVKARIELFGWIDKDELEFMDSADLTKSDYEKAVKEFDASFSFSDGVTEENVNAYVDQMHSVLDEYTNPRVQKQMLAALAKSYEARTGVQAMTADEVLALEAQEAEDGADDPGFVQRLVGTLFGAAKSKGKAEQPPKQEEETEQSAGEEAAMAEEGAPASEYLTGGGGGASGGGSSGGVASSYAAAGSAPAQPVILTEPEQEEAASAEVQGPVYRPQTGGEVQGPVYRPDNSAKYQNRIAYDPEMTDAQALAHYNRGATLDEKNLEQIRWFLNNKNAQGLNFGTGMYSYIPGESGARGAVDKFAYYGTSIGSAATMLASGSLPEDIANTATLALGRVIDEIDQIVANPQSGISVPAGQNMYEYVLGLPQYKGLASQVAAVAGTDVQVKQAYAEQAILEQEAKQAQLERDRAAIRNGTATQETLERVAVANTNDYADIGSDKTRAMYRYQMSERAGFYADDGTFWQGGSAAAQEGLNLRRAGGMNGQTYGLFKSALKDETYRVLDEYTEAAVKMGMSLEDYLGGAGINSLDHIISIAYGNMQAKGSAYAADKEAQEAAGAIATTSIGAWDSAVLGARSGAESYAADFMQTSYMALDAADYNLRRADLMNEYREEYGEEQAARMYYADLMALIDSGTLSQETGADLLDHMNRARNIFDVAYEIDPGFLRGLMRTGREGLQKDVEALETVAAMLPEGERAVFNAVSGLTYSLTGGAVSTAAGGLTGSALLGSALGWGTTEYANAYDANRAAGMSPGMASFVSLGNAALTTATNMGGVGSQMDTLFGGTAYQEFKKALNGGGGTALMKAMGKEVLQHAHEEGMEELTELAAGATFDLLDKEFLALDAGADFSLSRMFTNIVSSMEETDVASLYKEAIASYGMGAVYGGVFSLAGVGRQAAAARKAVKAQNSYESVSMAMQMADGELPFTEENVGRMYAQLQKDLDDPKFRKWIDSGALAAREQNASVTAILAGTGDDIRKSAAAEIQKAADYEEKARSARTASSESEGRWWAVRERVLGGDMEAIPALESARMAWAKAQTTVNETETAAQKARDSAADKAGSWLRQAMAEGHRMKSAEMQRYTAQIGALRTAVADVLAEKTEAREADNILAVEKETFIDERYPDADEETQEEIRANTEWNAQAGEAEQDAKTGRGIKNAVDFASKISKRFGVPIEFNEGIEGGAQGAYEDGVIHIDKGMATQSEVIRRVMVHELTHRAESSKWYGELRDALVEIGYGSDAERFAADKAAKMNAYNDHAAATGSGKTYSEAEIEQEIVADLAGNLFTADEAAIERLVQEKPNLMQRIYEAVRDFVRKLRGVNDPELDRIRNAERLMRKALDTASDDSSGTRFSIKTTGDGTRYVLVDTDQDIFDGHEPREYPAIAREYIKNRFRHTIIGEGENRAFVDARTGGEYTNPANRRMDAETFEGKMRASTELDNLIKASKYVENSGPVARHPEFPGGFDLQDVVFQVSDRLFEGRLNIGIDDKGRRRLYDLTKIKSLDSGSWVKQHGGAAAQTSGLSSTDSIAERRKFDNRKYSLPSAETLNQEISAYRARENRPAVQTGMTEQAGAQRQEAAPAMGERQFATKTAQESGAMPEWLKQELMSDPQQRYYERDSNNAQLMRAWERYRQEGYEGVRNRILAAEHFTADDIADANMIMAMAFRNEDVATALQVAQKYNTEGTKEGQTLQARSIFKRMTPTGIRTWAAGQAEARLADYIQTHTRTKRDVDATASDIAEKIRDMQAGDEILRLNAAGSFRIDSSNNKWGVPINEQQKALIDQYGLGKIERPGLFYNRATRKQRMLEAILATPNPLEVTGNGLNLIQRLEYMQAGQAVITNADLNYIGHQLAQYAAMDADAQQEREGDLALSRAYEAYGNIQPASMEEKARTWRYTSMLLSIPSAGRNIIGNAAQNAVNATAHGIAVELDKLASLVTGQRTMEHLSAAERAQGWNAFADETVNTFKDFYVDKTVTATMRGDDRFDSNRRGRVYETGFLEAARLAEGYLMSVGDRNFWKKAYVNSIAEQQRVAARNGETLDMSEAAEIARAEANYATFNEDSSVRDLFTRLKQNDNVLIRSIADFLMPFTGVPTNITKRMIEYSPAGLISTVINRAFDAARGRDFDQKRFITELSRGLTGTALFGVGMLLKEAGLIMLGTSDEDDSKAYGVRTAQGAQYSPYIRVGDEYVSLAAFAPSVSPLIMGATAIDIFHEDGSRLDALYNACLAGFDQIFDASYMSAIQDIFTGYGSAAENIGQTVLNSAISQNVPAVLGQLATSLDPYVRDTKDKDMLMQALKSGLIQKIPGVREMLPEKVDVAGRSVISKEGLRNFFDPFTTTNAADDPVLDEMMRIYEATGESSFMPVDALSGTKNTLTVNKEKIIVDGKDKETYRKRYGEIWYEGVERLMARPSFARMSDEKKMEEIAKIVKSAKDKAAKEIAKEIKQRGSDAR